MRRFRMSDPRATAEKTGARKDTRTRTENKPAHEPVSRTANDQFMLFQRTFGNSTMGRLLHHGFIPPKLTVSRSNDIYEQEADKMAAEVMRTPYLMFQRQGKKEEEENNQTKPHDIQLT